MRWLALLLLVCGCDNVSDAKAQFASDFTCPEARVELRPRKDVTAFMLAGQADVKPSPEIAADPERLAMWTQERKDLEASWSGACEVFEVRGCGKEALYCCGRLSRKSRSDHHNCGDRPYPDGVKAWSAEK